MVYVIRAVPHVLSGLITASALQGDGRCTVSGVTDFVRAKRVDIIRSLVIKGMPVWRLNIGQIIKICNSPTSKDWEKAGARQKTLQKTGRVVCLQSRWAAAAIAVGHRARMQRCRGSGGGKSKFGCHHCNQRPHVYYSERGIVEHRPNWQEAGRRSRVADCTQDTTKPLAIQWFCGHLPVIQQLCWAPNPSAACLKSQTSVGVRGQSETNVHSTKVEQWWCLQVAPHFLACWTSAAQFEWKFVHHGAGTFDEA